MMQADTADARFSPDFVDEVRSNVDRLVRELKLAPGEAGLGLAHLLGELLSLKASSTQRHAEAQVLYDYIVTIADETARGRLWQPSVGEENGA